MRKHLFCIIVAISCSIFVIAQNTNWQHVGDSIEYLSHNNAKVGIGTSNPTYSLDVVGNVRISNSGNNLTIKATSSGVNIEAATGPFYFSRPINSRYGIFASGPTADMKFNTNNTTRLTIKRATGYVGIGTTSPQALLDVRGTMRADEIIVNDVTGADFVFDKDYMLRSLDEVRSYIEEHQHLPEVPSARQMQEDGMSVDQMVVKLLQKVEELTLYTIQQEERIRELEMNIK